MENIGMTNVVKIIYKILDLYIILDQIVGVDDTGLNACLPTADNEIPNIVRITLSAFKKKAK